MSVPSKEQGLGGPEAASSHSRRRGDAAGPADPRPHSRRAAGPGGTGSVLTFCRVTRTNTAPASESCRRRFP